MKSIRKAWTPLLFVALCACAEPPHRESLAPPDPGAYLRELDVWRSSRVESLTGPEGWVTLAGLFWMEEGKTYTVGGDPASDIKLPQEHAPLHIGSLSVQAGSVNFRSAASGAGTHSAATQYAETRNAVTHDGVPVASIALRSDKEGKPTVLTVGSVTFRVIDRAGRLGVRVKDSQHPLRTAFQGLSYFPVNSALRVDAVLMPHEAVQSLRILNILGQSQDYIWPGTLKFTIDRKEYTLDAVREPGEDFLFII